MVKGMIFSKFFNKGGCFVCMKSLSYKQYKWVKLNRRNGKEQAQVSPHFLPLPYKEIMTQNIMLPFPSLPYKEIQCQTICSYFCNCHIKKLFDTFLSLSNNFKSIDILSV